MHGTLPEQPIRPIPSRGLDHTNSRDDDDDVVQLSGIDKIKFPRTDYGWIL